MLTAFQAKASFFETFQVTDPRYVWDPLVHKAHGEDCYFAILRLHEQRRGVVEDLRKVADDLGIQSFAIYRVFGHYDILIRFWSTEQRVELLRPELRLFADRQFGVTIVRVARAYYDDWAVHHEGIDVRYVRAFHEDIRRLTSIEANPRADELTSAVARLREAHLLHYMDPETVGISPGEPVVKVYIALSREGLGNPDADVETIRTLMKKYDSLLMKSIYWCGEARPSFFLRAILPVAGFERLDRTLDELERELSEHHVFMRMETFIIATNEVVENDALTTDLPEASGTRWDQLSRHLTRDQRKSLQRHPQAFLEKMYRLYDLFSGDAVWHHFESVFDEILGALALQDTQQFQESLMFLASFEGWLTRYLTSELFPEELGSGWYQEVEGVLPGAHDNDRAVGDEPTRRRLTLGDFVRALGILTTAGRVNEDRVSRDLGENWLWKLDRVRPIRNKALHGAYIKIDWLPDASGDDSWYEIAERALAVGEMYNRLRERITHLSEPEPR